MSPFAIATVRLGGATDGTLARCGPPPRDRSFSKKLPLFLRCGENEGVHLGNLGLAYADLGDARKAIEFYEQALVIARDLGDKRTEGKWLETIGLVYAALGDVDKAIEFYEQALVIARDIGDKRNEGVWLGNLGIAYADLGETRKAIEFHEQNRDIAREIGDRRGQSSVVSRQKKKQRRVKK